MQVLSRLKRANRFLPPALITTLVVAGSLIAPTVAAAAPTIQTTTTINCGSAIRFPEASVSCTVRVRSSSGAPAPSGTAKLTAENGQIPASCTLLPFQSEGLCPVTYKPKKGGLQTISASYPGSQTHLPSSGTTKVAVSETATTLSCSPERFSVAEGATCTAEVHNAGAASDNLSGTLSFELPRGGKLEPSSCNVAVSNPCTLKFSADIGDFYVINATYGGDATHPASKAQELLFGLEASATTVDCGSAVHFPGEKVECLVRVEGFHSSPHHGDVDVSLTAGGREVASCSLQGQGETDAACNATFTVHEPGVQTVTANYPGDVVHLPSSGQTTVAVSGTATSLKCQPQAIAVGEFSLCTAEVKNTGAASDNLSGPVRFVSDQNGRFEPSSCDVAKDNPCTVKYLPEMGAQHRITVTYEGDATHPASTSEAAALAVRGTSVKLICSQEGPAIPEFASCFARVVNEGLGSRSLTGTVKFTTSNEGSFRSDECTLTPFDDGDGGFCFMRYTLEESGVHVIRAAYSGDATHPPAIDGKAELKAQFPPTSTTILCTHSPLPFEPAVCEVVVRDESTAGATPPTGPLLLFTENGDPQEFIPCPELEPINSRTSECFTEYIPRVAGSQILTAKYPGDKTHGPSVAKVRLIHLTTTSVDCGGPIVLGAVTTCTATVRDAEGGFDPPRGVAQFTASLVGASGVSAGEFDKPDCVLKNRTQGIPDDTSICSVTFKPLTTVATISIGATYSGDSDGHEGSSGTTNLIVRSP